MVVGVPELGVARDNPPLVAGLGDLSFEGALVEGIGDGWPYGGVPATHRSFDDLGNGD